MKEFLKHSIVTSLFTTSALATTMQPTMIAEASRIGPETFTSAGYRPGNVKHIVLLKYKDSVGEAQRTEVIRRFLALSKESRRNGLPYIVNITTGRQHSGEGVDHGFQQGFIVTFKSEGDRNYYVGEPIVTDPRYVDPAHARFKQFVGPLLAEDNGVLVFDYTDLNTGK